MNNKLIAMLMLASLCSLNTVYAASNYSFQQTQTQPVYNSQYVQQQCSTVQVSLCMVM